MVSKLQPRGMTGVIGRPLPGGRGLPNAHLDLPVVNRQPFSPPLPHMPLIPGGARGLAGAPTAVPLPLMPSIPRVITKDPPAGGGFPVPSVPNVPNMPGGAFDVGLLARRLHTAVPVPTGTKPGPTPQPIYVPQPTYIPELPRNEKPSFPGFFPGLPLFPTMPSIPPVISKPQPPSFPMVPTSPFLPFLPPFLLPFMPPWLPMPEPTLEKPSFPAQPPVDTDVPFEPFFPWFPPFTGCFPPAFPPIGKPSFPPSFPPVIPDFPVVIDRPEPPVIVKPPHVDPPRPPVIADPPVVVKPPVVIDPPRPPVVVKPPVVIDPPRPPVVVKPPVVIDPPKPPVVSDPPDITQRPPQPPETITKPPVDQTPPDITQRPPTTVTPPSTPVSKERGQMWDVWFDRKEGTNTVQRSPIVLDLNGNGRPDITGSNVLGNGKIEGKAVEGFDLDPTKRQWETKSVQRRPGSGAPALPRGSTVKIYGADGSLVSEMKADEAKKSGKDYGVKKGQRAEFWDAEGRLVGELKREKPNASLMYFFGNANKNEWTKAWEPGQKGDGILVWDKDGDGKITSGKELFGETDVDGTRRFANGYEKLATHFDANKDGVVSGAELDGLKVWEDRNGDGLTQQGELVDVREEGVTSLDTRFDRATMGSSYGK